VNGVDVKGLLRYLSRHPRLAPVVLRAGWRLRARAWWRHAPFLPLPAQSYWSFRVMTATGSAEGTLSASDVVEAAAWSARQPVGRRVRP